MLQAQRFLRTMLLYNWLNYKLKTKRNLITNKNHD